jgi:ABC-type branched-subunit amino acid transport system substrate-binding protein
MAGKLPACIAIAFSLSCALMHAGGLTPEERRGKRIYLEGSPVSGGEITAKLDRKGAAIPASIVPCGGCHGPEGRGRPEGGINPPNITWEVLTKSRSIDRARSPKHPPYTERLLRRAILAGVDSGGAPLADIMPRYQMRVADLNDLIAYLRVLGSDSDLGISSSEVRVGVILPPGQDFSETREAVITVLNAYAQKINQAGGIFDRKLTIRFFEPPEDRSTRARQTALFLDRENIFVLMSSFLSGSEEEIASLLTDQRIPLIGASALYPQTAPPYDRYIFYLWAGVTDQACALCEFAAGRNKGNPQRALIIHGEDRPSISAAAVVEAHCKRYGWAALETIQAHPSSLHVTLLAKNADVVFVIAPGLAQAVLREDGIMPPTTIYLIPNSLVDFDSSALPRDLLDRVFISLPAVPADNSSSGLLFYKNLFHDTPPAANLAAQQFALSSAALLTEALRRAGRDVRREQIVDILETFRDMPTGLSPKLTFGPNRRVGSSGAYVLPAGNATEYYWIDQN